MPSSQGRRRQAAFYVRPKLDGIRNFTISFGYEDMRLSRTTQTC